MTHWFEALAEHMGSAYLRYSFTRRTAAEVDVLMDALDLAEGDVLTVPKGLMHEFVNNSDEAVVAYVVRGGDAPAAATLFGPTARSAASN